MVQTDYQSELLEIWRNKRFSDSITAKVYEGTKIGHQTHTELEPIITKTLFIHCIPDCESCDGYVVIVGANRRYKCGCIHHTLLESKR